MAVIFLESFDSYGSGVYDRHSYPHTKGSFLALNNVGNLGPRADIVRFTTHTPNYCFPMKFGSGHTIYYTIGWGSPNYPASGIIGTAIRFQGDSSGIFEDTTYGTIFFDGWYQVIRHPETNCLLMYKRGTTGVMVSGTTPLLNDTWYYLEIKYKYGYNLAVGSLEFRVDEQTDGINENVVSMTGQDGSSGNFIYLLGNSDQYSSASHCVYFDDLYFLNHSDGVNTGFLGDITVQPIFSNASGDVSQLVGTDNDSINNYLNVDEIFQDSFATANSGWANSGDLYHYQNISIYAKNVIALSIDSVVGAGNTTKAWQWSKVANTLKPSGTIYQQNPQTPNGPTYGQVKPIWDVLNKNPETDSAWTIDEVNNCQFGINILK